MTDPFTFQMTLNYLVDKHKLTKLYENGAVIEPQRDKISHKTNILEVVQRILDDDISGISRPLLTAFNQFFDVYVHEHEIYEQSATSSSPLTDTTSSSNTSSAERTDTEDSELCPTEMQCSDKSTESCWSFIDEPDMHVRQESP